ncbi:Holliday junction branch migration protein RuvA [Derxia lacustris]|uniref:Holliday junction branch migration protein RuvA n=1 Tax=Derxia lacustris TaxID=764842 RepID=UPI000A174FCC|nr:Holliday junction branch migration protein RuvA [Derxia lacustris]
MIGKLTGRLLEKTPPTVLVDVHGVGYEVDVPMSTFYALPPLGETVSLRTHFVVREDAQLLYGFATEAERAAFRQLLKISGVGARIALAVLSGLSVDELALAIVQQEAAQLVRVPGIGKKTAERLLLELKGKIGAPAGGLPAGLDGAPGTAANDADQSDVLNALVALGYSEREAVAVVKKLPPGASVEDGIRAALRLLARG